MIKGIGTDLIEIERIESLLHGTSGKRFMTRILTEKELLLAKTRSAKLAEFVAGRFCAKEAVVKALGCGIGHLVGFQDMEILADSAGKPECTLSERSLELLIFPNKIHIHVSITHSKTMAAATAIVEIHAS